MRVSLTADPVEEVIFAKEILQSIGMLPSSINLVSCPTCGRTKIGLEVLADQIEKRLQDLEIIFKRENRKPITIAVMGCAVNGPGEAKEADYGVAGGDGKGIIFEKGKILKTVSEDKIVDELFKIIEKA